MGEFKHSPFTMLGDEEDGGMDLPFADEGCKAAIQYIQCRSAASLQTSASE